MLRCIVAALAAIALVGCSTSSPHMHASSPRSSEHSTVVHSSVASPPPQEQPPAHVVVVIEENHGYNQIIGNPAAPYMNQLANSGRLLTQMYAITHPSQPNYLALFSGSTHGITDDSCPHTFSDANLGSELIGAGLTFTGFSESMPSDGYTGCTSG